MGQITLTQLSDGATHTAADHNNNNNTIANAINGNLDATNISAGSLTNALFGADIAPYTRQKENFANFVQTGLTIPTSASLSTTIATGVAYINGKRVNPSAFPLTVTASKDTYIYLKDDGTYVTTNNVANNATSPAASTNSDSSTALLVGIVISNGTAITAVNQGSPTASGPTVSSVILTVTDSLGNLIYPTSPTPGLVGFRSDTSGAFTVNSNTDTDITRLSLMPVIVPAGKRLKLTAFVDQLTPGGSANARVQFRIYEGATQIASENINLPATNVGIGGMVVAYISPTAGLHTYKATLARDNVNTVITFSCGTTNPAILSAELV